MWRVVDYDLAWERAYREEAKRIQDVLGDNCVEIYHIGSTAVPGLAAKPILDILPGCPLSCGGGRRGWGV